MSQIVAKRFETLVKKLEAKESTDAVENARKAFSYLNTLVDKEFPQAKGNEAARERYANSIYNVFMGQYEELVSDEVPI